MSEVVSMAVSVATSSFTMGAPLALAATGEIVSERSGVLNLATEGLMLLGALAGVYGAMQGWGAAGAMACAAAVGLAGGLLVAAVTVWFQGHQIVAGIAFNLAALGLSDVLMRRLTLARGADLILAERVRWLVPAAYLAIPVFWFLLHRTGAGLVVRAAGEEPRAIETFGSDVALVRTAAVIVGATLAALGGAVFSVACEGYFRANMTSGRGYIAVAIVYFANWNVWAVLWTTLLFGAADKCQLWLRLLIPGAEAVGPLLQSVPYVLTVLVLALFVGRSRTPRALMRPYRREESGAGDW